MEANRDPPIMVICYCSGTNHPGVKPEESDDTMSEVHVLSNMLKYNACVILFF